MIAIDQPGNGRSPGDPRGIRSENNLDAGGPVDITYEVLSKLGIKSVTIGGFDWGGGIALSFCLKHPKLVSKIILFLPSYAEKVKDELKTITKKTLIVWVKQDQFHIWNKWKPLADKIPSKTFEMIDMKVYDRKKAGGLYQGISDQVMRIIVMFLGGLDPLKSMADIKVDIKKDQFDAKGGKVVAKMNINFAEDLQGMNLNEMREDDSASVKTHVDTFMQRWAKVCNGESFDGIDKFNEWMNSVFLEKSDSAMLNQLRALPEICPDTLQADPGLLVNLGVWENLPENISQMWSSPRYFPGRQVIGLGHVSPFVNKKSFMFHSPEESGSEKFTTPLCRIVSLNAGARTAEVEFAVKNQGYAGRGDPFKYLQENSGSEWHKTKIPFDQLLLLNHPQVFSKDGSDKYIFEDGIRGNYGSLAVRAKLLQISLHLKPIIENLDFGSQDHQSIIDQQIKAVKILRRCLNVTGFCNGVDRSRHGRTDDIGKLGHNGQVHCHGYSSTLSAYLLPFLDILGIDLLYRGGTSYGKSDEFDGSKSADLESCVSNSVELHQWVQVTLRPSMKSFLVDGWYMDCNKSEMYIGWPIAEAYMGLLNPHPKLLLQNKIKFVSETDFSEFF